MINQNNLAVTRDITFEELGMVSGGNGASDSVVEEQIETVLVNGSWGGVTSGTTNALASNYGGGYGSFLSATVPSGLGHGAVATANKIGEDLENGGGKVMTIAGAVALKYTPAGKVIYGIGFGMWASGLALQTIEY